VRLDKNRILSEFFSVFVQTAAYARQVYSRAKTAVAQATITQDDLDSLLLPIPPAEEQQMIAEVIFTIDKKFDLERDEKLKLERIKQGLMDLLLTGKIRVKAD
jgi:type I restriction enzyme S subunit